MDFATVTIESESAMMEEVISILRAIYNKWRLASNASHCEAALRWGAWLIKHDNGAEAAEVIATARSSLMNEANPAALPTFEARWSELLEDPCAVGELDGKDVAVI